MVFLFSSSLTGRILPVAFHGETKHSRRLFVNRPICVEIDRGVIKGIIGSVCLAVLFFAACQTTPTGRRQLQRFPADQVAQMSDAAYGQMRKKEPIVIGRTKTTMT